MGTKCDNFDNIPRVCDIEVPINILLDLHGFKCGFRKAKRYRNARFSMDFKFFTLSASVCAIQLTLFLKRQHQIFDTDRVNFSNILKSTMLRDFANYYLRLICFQRNFNCYHFYNQAIAGIINFLKLQ